MTGVSVETDAQTAPTVVHPTAIVEPGARLGAGVRIGPFSIIGPEVELGDGVTVESHVVIQGRTAIGNGCRIFPFAAIGLQPQDRKFKGEASALSIGADTVIREYVTVNTGTEGGGMMTRIGERCLLLAHAHVGHDCQIGNGVLLVNNVLLGGHVEIGDHASLGGGSAVHQFVRIGAYAFLGGLAGLEHDLIPFGMAIGNRAHLAGLNLVGMKRHGFPREDIHAVRSAYRALFAESGTLASRTEAVAASFGHVKPVAMVTDFIRAGGHRSLCTPLSGNGGAADDEA